MAAVQMKLLNAGISFELLKPQLYPNSNGVRTFKFIFVYDSGYHIDNTSTYRILSLNKRFLI